MHESRGSGMSVNNNRNQEGERPANPEAASAERARAEAAAAFLKRARIAEIAPLAGDRHRRKDIYTN